MGALREIQAEKPELFEEDPPLLAERSDIPGVGLAEEPPKINGERQSFNQSREDVLEEAWKMVLDDVMGNPSDKQYEAGEGGLIIDKRLINLRQSIERGDRPMGQVVNAYRTAIRKIAPKYGVSPDNFSRNL
jgi:hypothetical protein